MAKISIAQLPRWLHIVLQLTWTSVPVNCHTNTVKYHISMSRNVICKNVLHNTNSVTGDRSWNMIKLVPWDYSAFSILVLHYATIRSTWRFNFATASNKNSFSLTIKGLIIFGNSSIPVPVILSHLNKQSSEQKANVTLVCKMQMCNS